MATPEEIKSLKEQIQALNKQLDEAGGSAIDLNKAFASAGDDVIKLNKVLETVKKSLKDITDSSNYVFRTFRDITAELKNQNLLLKIGNSSFKAFSDIAQNVNYYQKGNLDLTDKQIKKSYQTLDIEKKELEFVVERLGNKKGEFYQDSRISSLQDEIKKADTARKKILEARLGILIKEKTLYNNAKEAIASGIPILQKELDLSKQIFTVRQDLGGIAVNASKILTKFGGSLSQFLNLNEAVASAEEYNKKIVLGALNNKEVQNQLLEIEKEKVGIQNQLDTGRFKDEKTGKFIKATEEERIKRQKQLISLETDAEKVKLNAVASTNTLVNKFKTLGILTKEMGIGLAKSLTDPITLITFFSKVAFKADQQVTDLAKSLGIGKDQAEGLRQNFVAYARSSSDAFVTTDRLVKAQGELSQELGVAGKYTGKQAEDFSRLTELIGLSASEAGKLARLSVVNSTSIEDTTRSIIKGSVAAQQSNKISIDQRTILKEVANLSEGILIKFQGNPEALGRAVVEAKKLGTTLDTIDKIGESLLNFESSIENQLKAQLLTGKQLNLEQARYAALTGDQVTLTREVANQVGSLANFQGMNVIAQKSLAEAFGLSRDELSKMLLEQEKVNKLGDVSKMTLDEQLKVLKAQGEPLDSILYKQIQQQSAAEKFNIAITKLQDLIGNLVAGPLGGMLDVFANIAKHASVLYGIMGALVGISLVKTIGSLISMAATLAASSISAITLSSALTFGLSTIAILAAIGVIAGAMSSTSDSAVSKAQTVKDGIAPSNKGPFTITDDYGATAITSKGDNIAVSPNINNLSIPQPSPQTIVKESINKPQIPMANYGITKEDMKETFNDLLNGILNRPQATPQFALHVDGRQIGTAIGKQMETGTAQNIYTGYKVA